VERDAAGLPVPPSDLVTGYADSIPVYLESGGRELRALLDITAGTGFALPARPRILDFGCGIARLIRHLSGPARAGEVWGVDISAPHIQWCKVHLSPPFHFATTTTIPHLPFPDRTFDWIYAASVFTHVEELADAWLLELRRIVAPEGRVCLTIHDESTLELLAGAHADHWLAGLLRADPVFRALGGEFGMLVVGRDAAAQVFYNRKFFATMLAGGFETLTVRPAAHGYQTAYVLRSR
jgi:ubiquinone/menaquinone biosynthesis C-methylase UbiE